MPVNNVLPFASTVVMAIFTFSVFQRYLVRRNLAFLYWGIGLLMFGLGSFAEAYLALRWNQSVFVIWWLFGAVLNPAWLGQGTLQLLFKKRWVPIATIILALASAWATWVVVSTPLDASSFVVDKAISVQYKTMWPGNPTPLVRLLPIPFGTYGLITLVGGALYSGYLLWRKRVLPNRVIGNVMIAAGSLTVAVGSALAGKDVGQYLYVTELIAAILMFGGFAMAAGPAIERAPEQSTQTASAD